MTSGDGLLDELALWGEVEAVVEDAGPGDGDELVTEETDFTVEDETLEVKMGETENGHGRGVTRRECVRARAGVVWDLQLGKEAY